jgi:hypothetical protein
VCMYVCMYVGRPIYDMVCQVTVEQFSFCKFSFPSFMCGEEVKGRWRLKVSGV